MSRLPEEVRAIRRIYRLIHDIYVLLDATDHYLIEQYDITVSQFHLLNVLLRKAPCRLIQLSEHLLVARSTVTRLIDQLEQKEMVRRLPDKNDRRAFRVTLTKYGRKMMSEIVATHACSLQESLIAFSLDDIASLENLLSRMRVDLDMKLKSISHRIERREHPRTNQNDEFIQH